MLRTVMVLLAIFSVPVTAQNEAVTYHDLSAMATWPLGNMQVKGATGKSGSFALAEMPIGRRGPAGNPHHHSQEQIVIGISGSPIVGVSGIAYRLASYGAVITPAQSEHFQTNGSMTATSTFIEFQPVLRHDWFPPYPKATTTQSASPVVVPRTQRVFEDLDISSEGWQTGTDGARSKVTSGQTVRLTMWDLSAANASADLNASGAAAERFVYVFEGEAEIAVGSSRRNASAQTLAVLAPGAKAARLRSSGKGRTLVGVFETTQN